PAERGPVTVPDAVLRLRIAWTDPGLVVLQSATEPVGRTLIYVDSIELAGGEAVLELPALSAVHALVESAIGAEQQAAGPARINDEVVIVGVDILEPVLAPGLPPVLRDVDDEAEHVDALTVGRVDANLAEVERARVKPAHPGPVLARVVGAEDPAGLAFGVHNVRRPFGITLHDGVHDLRILGPDGEADSLGPGRQSGREFLPRSAAVGALPDPAKVLAVGGVGAGDELPGVAAAGVEGRIEYVGGGGVEGEVTAADPIAVGCRRAEDQLPSGAAVGGLVAAALAPGNPEIAGRRHPGGLRVGGMDHDPGDGLAGLEADVGPGLPAVSRAVDAVAPARAVAVVGLAGPDPDNGVVGRGDRQSADRGDGLMLE